MYRESLERAREILAQVLLVEEQINLVDKMELVMNVEKFLDPDSYDHNIQTLEKERVKCKEYSRQTSSPQKRTF